MAAHNFNDLIQHLGHHVTIVFYAIDENYDKAQNVAIECEDCHEILLDFNQGENNTTKSMVEGIFREVFAHGFKAGTRKRHNRSLNDYWQKFWNNV